MTLSVPAPTTFVCFRSRASYLPAAPAWLRPTAPLSRNRRWFRQVRPPVTPPHDNQEPAGGPPRPGAVLTIAEASHHLRVSRWMIYRLIHSRQLKTIKLGRRRLIPARALNELVDQLTNQEPW